MFLRIWHILIEVCVYQYISYICTGFMDKNEKAFGRMPFFVEQILNK